ncbi:A24 family peptidase [Thalassotalea ponticola]|uniref:prepilin peptidase n=1 Tax=Thalassotalea ponticola TaxID=1523392 RepID=UPI0025B35118|nr:A24 family peptidase [Thalassotalea ponticola]MDN3653579.1 A24 family peptidase [Thalassotalea ponticola]
MLSDLISLFNQYPVAFYSSCAVLGLLVGSFLNVVIYRLPKMMQAEWACECRELLADELTEEAKKSAKQSAEQSAAMTLSKPASSCPKCGAKIKPWQNIPVISWLLLRGKCAKCSNPISMRYPIIELLSGLASLVVAMHFGVTWQALFMIVLTWCLIALTMIDFDHMILPDQITLPLVWLGLILGLNNVFVSLDQAVIGAIAGYMSLWSIYWLFKLATGKEGMGYGDFKLFAVFGAWFGWQLLPLLILMASLVGAVIGVSLILFKRHEGSKPIPFGPYLAIAGWICALWGQQIWARYMGLLG